METFCKKILQRSKLKIKKILLSFILEVVFRLKDFKYQFAVIFLLIMYLLFLSRDDTYLHKLLLALEKSNLQMVRYQPLLPLRLAWE